MISPSGWKRLFALIGAARHINQNWISYFWNFSDWMASPQVSDSATRLTNGHLMSHPCLREQGCEVSNNLRARQKKRLHGRRLGRGKTEAVCVSLISTADTAAPTTNWSGS